jgi:hypothetical protein
VDEAKVLFNQVESWAIQHVGRENNTASHRLVQLAATRMEDHIWLSNFPDFIYSFVNFDLDRS